MGCPATGSTVIFEALRTRQDKIRFIQVRHEEAAAFAACGYAKYRQENLGVCLATSGPGGIHLLNGLYDAKMDGQPVLAITGHTFHDLIGTHYQQDVDLDELFRTSRSTTSASRGPAHVVNVLDEPSVRARPARRGAHHVFPRTLQEWTCVPEWPLDRQRQRAQWHAGVAVTPQLPPQADLRAAADIINQGKKVVILAGRGAPGCRDRLLAFAEKVAGRIVKPLLGKAVVPDDSPYTTGGIGLLGTAPSQDAMKECDTLVILGSSFPYLEFLPKPGQAKCVQIGRRSQRALACVIPSKIGLVGDCGCVLDGTAAVDRSASQVAGSLRRPNPTW